MLTASAFFSFLVPDIVLLLMVLLSYLGSSRWRRHQTFTTTVWIAQHLFCHAREVVVVSDLKLTAKYFDIRHNMPNKNKTLPGALSIQRSAVHSWHWGSPNKKHGCFKGTFLLICDFYGLKLLYRYKPNCLINCVWYPVWYKFRNESSVGFLHPVQIFILFYYHWPWRSSSGIPVSVVELQAGIVSTKSVSS